jgi:hypothetical protein
MAVEPGKTHFTNRIEYPLPSSGGRDYVFYPEKTDPYVQSARAFFLRWYSKHRAHTYTSLEGLIGTLHGDITQHGVQQVRELVIVAHANPVQMSVRILADAQASKQHGLQSVNHLSLARLQTLLPDPAFKGFKDKRAIVVSRLLDTSWVTIRACRFGLSREGMYALYSFFGGRADVYAPKLYQHFLYCPLTAFPAVGTEAKLHDHLVRQRFFPKKITPERARAFMTDLEESPLYSETHALASTPISGETTEYKALLQALSERRVVPPLTQTLSAFMAARSVPDWSPSKGATVKRVAAKRAWHISDTIRHSDVRYYIHFKLAEEEEADTRTLLVQASLSFTPAAPKQDRRAYLQFFLDDDPPKYQYRLLRGEMFRIAQYATSDVGPERKANFDKWLSLLKAMKYMDPTDAALDLRPKFKEINVTLTAPQLTLIESQFDATPPRASWKIQEGRQLFLIKLETPVATTGALARTLTVYPLLTKKQQLAHDVAILTGALASADVPGTELAAYLDRLPLDDLLSVIEHLRTPFKPGHAVVIAQAAQAMKRKRGFEQWVMDREPDRLRPEGTPLFTESGWELSESEREDRRQTSYEADFNATWTQAKAVMQVASAFQTDLFAEEDLVRKLQIPPGEVLDDWGPDSPTSETFAPSDFESAFAAAPAGLDKTSFDEREESPTADCRDFKQALDAAMAIKDKDAEEIAGILKGQTTARGDTLFDILQPLASNYSFIRRMGNFVQFPEGLPWIPSSVDGVITEPISRVLKNNLSGELSWWLEGEGVLIARTAMLQTGLALLWAWGVVMVPGKMLLHVAEELMRTEEHLERVGEATAMLQWLREVENVTYRAATVPDLHELDISTPVPVQVVGFTPPWAGEPYHTGRLFYEVYLETGAHQQFLISSPAAVKRGFDRAALAMKFNVADELTRRAQTGMSELLKRWGFDDCEVDVLIKAGLLDLNALHSQVVSELAGAVRKQLPRLA